MITCSLPPSIESKLKSKIEDYTLRLQLPELVKIGLERNIIVYDADAKPGVLSRRLISLASTVNRRNNSSLFGHKIHSVYINKPGFLDFAKTIYHNDTSLLGGEKVFGIDIKISNINLTKLYLKLGGSFPRLKRKIALFVSNNDCLLGAY